MEYSHDRELSPQPPTVVRALLIDLDNCPRQIERLPETLTEYARVIACYGGTEPKVPLGMVPLLATAIYEGRLAIIGMQKKGKNAADFGLAFWAGRLAAEMPPDTEFLILSQDTDLDHVVHMLQGAKRQVERLDGKVHRTKRIATDPPQPQVETDDDVVTEYCTVYLQPARSRPVRKVTLSNSIRAFCKNHRKNIKPEDILHGLVARGVVVIDDNGRVTYPETVTAPSTTAVVSELNGTPLS
jgi:PIN domain-containing protein